MAPPPRLHRLTCPDGRTAQWLPAGRDWAVRSLLQRSWTASECEYPAQHAILRWMGEPSETAVETCNCVDWYSGLHTADHPSVGCAGMCQSHTETLDGASERCLERELCDSHAVGQGQSHCALSCQSPHSAFRASATFRLRCYTIVHEFVDSCPAQPAETRSVQLFQPGSIVYHQSPTANPPYAFPSPWRACMTSRITDQMYGRRRHTSDAKWQCPRTVGIQWSES